MKDILVLGSGMVVRPLLKVLARAGLKVTLASRTQDKNIKTARGLSGIQPIQFSLHDSRALLSLVAEHRLTLSMLPARNHALVAEACVRMRRDLVTTSYVGPEMAALDAMAKEAGVTLLNELGLDPGIDHMSALETIASELKQGGRVVSYVSYCGGLPAPHHNDNPLGYKFSWSPLAVLSAATQPAQYRRLGQPVQVPAVALFSAPELVDVQGVGQLEGYPNRNSLAYETDFGLSDAHTILRGTLRNLGHCETWAALAALGLLRSSWVPTALTCREFVEKCVGGSLAEAVRRIAAQDATERILARFDWLGLMSDEPVPAAIDTPSALLAHLMQARMQFAPGEQDMVALQHRFQIAYPDRLDTLVSTLVELGEPNGDSAMARTVGIPAALGALFILDRKWTSPGVHKPVSPSLYEPLLAELKAHGIGFQHTRNAVPLSHAKLGPQ